MAEKLGSALTAQALYPLVRRLAVALCCAGTAVVDKQRVFLLPRRRALRERAAFADNAVHYEATLRFINGQAKTMLTAIQGQ